jgi:Fe2+ transport system protein FeoA
MRPYLTKEKINQKNEEEKKLRNLGLPEGTQLQFGCDHRLNWLGFVRGVSYLFTLVLK